MSNKKPVFLLAPLANVTDAAFRRIIAKYGKPDFIYTEFVSADGLLLAHEEGRKKLLKDLEFDSSEKPIIAQFFTSTPKHMLEAAKLARELGFDGMDINMGCPDQSVLKQKAGAALMKDPKLARELIEAAKEGAGDLPVSVKTRLGFNKDELETWLPELLKAEPKHITLHLRTKKEMSKVAAHWDRAQRAVEIRDALNPKIPIFGNGDVRDLNDAREKVKETGVDGVMLGRAIFGNPWLFSEKVPTLEEKLRVMVEHTRLFEELLGGIKSFSLMKKHYKAYVNGFEGAAELRGKLMEAVDAEEVAKITTNFLS